jgi:hypothetical protein
MGTKKMNIKVAVAAALALGSLAPGMSSASMLLDTGTPSGSGPSVLLNSTSWYAAEFSVTAGQTITQLSAYLTQGVGKVGDTFTWDIYSAGGTFLGANRESPSFTTTGTFTGNGWNSVNASWAPTTAGLYWVALQVSGTAQTHGLNLPTEASTGSGTAPALAFAFAGTNGRYALETNSPVGFQVSAVPLPAAAWLFGSGLLGIASMVRRRRS